jgi:hypothetical protein
MGTMRIITDFVASAAMLTMATVCCAGAAAADAPASTDRYGVVYGARVKLTGTPASVLAARIGRPDSLDELVDRLLTVAQEYSGQPGAVTRPRVTLVEPEELQRMLCGRPCTIRAAYVPGDGLFIERELRPDLNDYHQSILFHELVHHVQEMRGIDGTLDACNRWRARESQAYALQNRFLRALGSHTQAIDPGSSCVSDRATRAQTFGFPAD